MRTTIYLISLSLFSTSIVGAAACGGPSEPEPNHGGDLPEATDPMDDPIPAEPIEAEVEEPEAPPAVPTTITLQLRVGSDNAEGTFTLLDVDGEVAASGSSGDEITIPSGDYLVQAELTQEVIGGSTHEEQILVEPGDPREVPIRIELARVRLNVTRNGRAIRNPQVTLMPEGGGEAVGEFRSGRDHVLIKPGRYQALVRFGANEITVNGLTFMGGATQDVPVNLE